MKCLRIPGWQKVAMVALLTFFSVSASAFAESPIKVKKLAGTIDLSTPGPSPLVFSGIGSHLGRFTARGEVDVRPGDEEGSLVGDGIVVVTAANGDLLVGAVTWLFDPDGSATAEFHWRDSVQFSDGTIVSNTGRFARRRPPGALIALEWLFVATILLLSIL